MKDNTPSNRDFLEKASFALIALQLAVFAKMWMDLGPPWHCHRVRP